jgi:hypothetical protein
MPFPQAVALIKHWDIENPPANEAIQIALRCYTSWGKEPPRPPTPEENRKSLERRWNAGAMNPKQIFEAFGGAPVQMIQAGSAPAVH